MKSFGILEFTVVLYFEKCHLDSIYIYSTLWGQNYMHGMYQITVSKEVTRKMQNILLIWKLSRKKMHLHLPSYTRGLLTHNGEISYSLRPKFKFKSQSQSQINILDLDIKA